MGNVVVPTRKFGDPYEKRQNSRHDRVQVGGGLELFPCRMSKCQFRLEVAA
jgi:hypothetical protein